jgi:exportin-7
MDAQQLAQVEALCETLYTGKSPDPKDLTTRQDAQARLLSLQSSAEYIPQCQYILDHSKSDYARLVASNSLTELVTTHWNNFTVSQRVDVRNYVLSYLANHGPGLADYVTTSLIKLVCRITKLGWFDDSAHRELVDDVTKFLQATVDHCILGLKILNQLVDELNIPTSGRTLSQHRKTSVSFRDFCLLRVFQLGLTTLKQLQTRAIGKANRNVFQKTQSCFVYCRCRILPILNFSLLLFSFPVPSFGLSCQPSARSYLRGPSPFSHSKMSRFRFHRNESR